MVQSMVASHLEAKEDGEYKLKWKVPDEIQHGENANLLLVAQGKWKNGKLNGENCKIYFCSTVNNNLALTVEREDLPQLIGTFNDNIIEKGKILVKDKWCLEFDSIQLSKLQMTANQYSGIIHYHLSLGHAYPYSRLNYHRYFIFNNGKWKSQPNGKLESNGSYFTRIDCW